MGYRVYLSNCIEFWTTLLYVEFEVALYGLIDSVDEELVTLWEWFSDKNTVWDCFCDKITL